MSFNLYKQIEIIRMRMEELNADYQERHSRILALRYDLHYPTDYQLNEDTGNKHISRCIAKIAQNLKRKGLDPSYAWVREQNQGTEHPHYHIQLLLNGNKIQSGYDVNSVVKNLWNSTIGVSQESNLVHCCNDNLKDSSYSNRTLYHRADTLPEIVDNQIGYLSKNLGKGEPKDGMRDFGTSRIGNSSKK